MFFMLASIFNRLSRCFIVFIIRAYVEVQDDKNSGRRGLWDSLQGHQHQNWINSGHKEDEAEVQQLERVHRAQGNQKSQETQP